MSGQSSLRPGVDAEGLGVRSLAPRLLSDAGSFQLVSWGRGQKVRDFDPSQRVKLEKGQAASAVIVVFAPGHRTQHRTWLLLNCFTNASVLVIMQPDHGKMAWTLNSKHPCF